MAVTNIIILLIIRSRLSVGQLFFQTSQYAYTTPTFITEALSLVNLFATGLMDCSTAVMGYTVLACARMYTHTHTDVVEKSNF